MGFSAPKPDPKIQAEQDAEAAQAKAQKITTLQGQLAGEDQVRARIYGSAPNPLYGAAPAKNNALASPIIGQAFNAMFGGKF